MRTHSSLPSARLSADTTLCEFRMPWTKTRSPRTATDPNPAPRFSMDHTRGGPDAGHLRKQTRFGRQSGAPGAAPLWPVAGDRRRRLHLDGNHGGQENREGHEGQQRGAGIHLCEFHHLRVLHDLRDTNTLECVFLTNNASALVSRSCQRWPAVTARHDVVAAMPRCALRGSEAHPPADAERPRRARFSKKSRSRQLPIERKGNRNISCVECVPDPPLREQVAALNPSHESLSANNCLARHCSSRRTGKLRRKSPPPVRRPLHPLAPRGRTACRRSQCSLACLGSHSRPRWHRSRCCLP